MKKINSWKPEGCPVPVHSSLQMFYLMLQIAPDKPLCYLSLLSSCWTLPPALPRHAGRCLVLYLLCAAEPAAEPQLPMVRCCFWTGIDQWGSLACAGCREGGQISGVAVGACRSWVRTTATGQYVHLSLVPGLRPAMFISSSLSLCSFFP